MKSRNMFKTAVFVIAIASVALAATPLPDPNDRPTMARFVVNHAGWTSFAYFTKDPKGNVIPGNAVFAMSDGKLGCGNGIPYFWVSREHPSVVELEDDDPRGALTMTLAQTGICEERGWDPQDPRCAHIVVYGKFHKIAENVPEYQVARNALLTRHPQFSYYPPGHKFFYAKMDISRITIISKFGGPIDVNLQDYLKVKSECF